MAERCAAENDRGERCGAHTSLILSEFLRPDAPNGTTAGHEPDVLPQGITFHAGELGDAYVAGATDARAHHPVSDHLIARSCDAYVKHAHLVRIPAASLPVEPAGTPEELLLAKAKAVRYGANWLTAADFRFHSLSPDAADYLAACDPIVVINALSLCAALTSEVSALREAVDIADSALRRMASPGRLPGETRRECAEKTLHLVRAARRDGAP